ncbi:uroporphyrinogen decarboxylase-like [Ruditapes philippinarum]|uniref:uroporphyrinogen decarboxylase-like n=1 Tax=Ruditapes philippinarum TaxID=129788 RepID=UPI00295B2CD4|nr:uroporphyrinogen decarboxylase-like [Ruditapes philippinarum]
MTTQLTLTEAFPPLTNDLILRAARGEKTERVPVWLMRQAGRYLPEYGEFKAKHNVGFFDMVKTPSMACEITLQPIRRFNLDAAIIFSDILVIPQVLGMGVDVVEGKGVIFDFLLETPEDLKKLYKDANVCTDLSYVFDAITMTRHALNGQCPLFGFSGAPWTLMKFMIDGGSHSPLPKARKWLVTYPNESRELLQLLCEKVVDYLVGQVKAGAQLLQVFDSCAGELGPDKFAEFSLPYLKDIAYRTKEKLLEAHIEPVPMMIENMPANPKRRIAGKHVTLQGNFDPCLLYSQENELKNAVKTMIKRFGTQRYIANLGHGVHKDVNPDNVGLFVDAVHMYSEEINASS